jgi:hypothetical protein
MSAALALTDDQRLVALWRAGVMSLPEDRIPCPGMILRETGPRGRFGVWASVRAAMLRFVDQWGEEAAALGWSTESLFGVHRLAGALRADSTGALVSLYPWETVAINEQTITFARNRTRQVYRGMTNFGDSVPIWSLRPFS